MSETKIPWATHTVNWLSGCTKTSEGCVNCYAEEMTARLATMPNKPARYSDGVVEDRKWTGHISYDPEALERAFEGMRNARKPRRVFCGSMSDLFHENVPAESLQDLAAEIRSIDTRSTDWPHVLMLLTKRPANMLAWQRSSFPKGLPSWVWTGATTENQRRADERLPVLLKVRAGLLFVSCEPLLGPVGIEQYLRSGIRWVLVGGETGRKARPLEEAWVEVIVNDCRMANVPVLMQRWSLWKDRLSARLNIQEMP